MSKNTHWSADDLRKKGLAQDANGNYVPVKSLVAKGKVDKLPNLIERAIPPDRITATKYAMGVDPYANNDKDVSAAVVVKKDGLVAQYIGRSKNEVPFPELLEEMVKYYDCKISAELNTIKIKPLTVNQCWKGERFKTTRYERYCEAVSLLLPNNIIVPSGLLRVYYEFGMSYSGADWDNPCKPLQDILQAKYKFNDSRIMEATVKKVIVKRGQEYIKFKIESL